MLNEWGFYNLMAPAGIGLFLLFSVTLPEIWNGREQDRDEAYITSFVLFLLLAFSYVGQIITIAVMRWGHAGRVCSGDFNNDFSFWSLDTEQPYMHKTGTWLFYSMASQMYVIMAFITGVSFNVGAKNF